MGLDLAQLKVAPGLLPFYRSGLHYILKLSGPGTREESCDSSEIPQMDEFWLARLQRCDPPCRVVLTYWHLCLDVETGQDSEAASRATLFQKILQSLNWPEGEYAFWPLSRSSEKGIVPDRELFWAGIKALKPEYVLFFGARAAKALFPEHTPRYEKYEHEGILFFELPDPMDMLPDNRRAKNFVWNRLKSLPISDSSNAQ